MVDDDDNIVIDDADVNDESESYSDINFGYKDISKMRHNKKHNIVQAKNIIIATTAKDTRWFTHYCELHCI